MKKIVLFCGGGMSSSLLVLKLRDAARAANVEVHVEAFSAARPEYAEGADVVLVAPQIRSEIEKIRSKITAPVDVIEKDAYGTMNGTKIFEQAMKLIDSNK